MFRLLGLDLAYLARRVFAFQTSPRLVVFATLSFGAKVASSLEDVAFNTFDRLSCVVFVFA